jgi:hypothetical protein
MDPWLEHPALWPGVHNRLIVAIADELVPKLAPRYFVAVEVRTYHFSWREDRKMGVPDLSIGRRQGVAETSAPYAVADMAARETEAHVVDVQLPLSIEMRESYIEIHLSEDRDLVTAIEVLSPANKLSGKGRAAYVRKRQRLFDSAVNLVEIDLVRAGRPMPVRGDIPSTDYRILVSRADTQPTSQMYVFNLPALIPTIPIPLDTGDDEPALALNNIFHDAYHRARFDLLVNYGQPPVPPLAEAAASWAAGLVATATAADVDAQA